MKQTPSSLVMLFVPLWSVNISLQVMSFTLKMKAGASTWFEPEGSLIPHGWIQSWPKCPEYCGPSNPPHLLFCAPQILMHSLHVLCVVCVEIATSHIFAPGTPPLSPQPKSTLGNWMWHATQPSVSWPYLDVLWGPVGYPLSRATVSSLYLVCRALSELERETPQH